MFGSFVSKSIAISFACDKSGKVSGMIHSVCGGNNNLFKTI
jgi:hypothetical protein